MAASFKFHSYFLSIRVTFMAPDDKRDLIGYILGNSNAHFGMMDDALPVGMSHVIEVYESTFYAFSFFLTLRPNLHGA